MKNLQYILLLVGVISTTLVFSQERAKIYIIRKSAKSPFIPAQVFVDGKEIGANMTKTFILYEAEAGTITISGNGVAGLTMEVQAGKTYYIEQKIKFVMGLFGTTSVFKEFKEGKGEKALAKCGRGAPPTNIPYPGNTQPYPNPYPIR